MARTVKSSKKHSVVRTSPKKNKPTKPALPVDLDARRAYIMEFSRRMTRLRLDRGWSQSDLARQAALHMADKQFGRDSISRYALGKHAPTATHLVAIAKAFGVKPEELLPGIEVDKPMKMPNYDFGADVRPFSMESREEGDVWLRVNTALPMETALRILDIIKESHKKPESGDAT